MNDQPATPLTWGTRDGGPVHQDAGTIWGQAWCGVRRQFRHINRDEAVTCPRCLRAIARGRASARGAR